MAESILETERLRLRRIEPGDAQLQFRLLNTPAVMHHLGGPLSVEAIEQKHSKSMDLHEHEGFSFLFLIERDTDEFVGHCGLKRVDAEGARNPGDFEIGWLIREDRWRRGYAIEAVRAVLRWAFVDHDAPHVVALTSHANEPSWRLMERLGMERREDLDFENPRFPPEDNPTILYSLGREAWDAQDRHAA
ncbi:GNAT family N-acetyltransferase [Erythrobacter sp. YJ-T3-07]|uniref:GNAT family N-acetyltransferase n=1 Tax=Erythrobacter sp. YJ-T3-07 TaxID=2793063 RepID=UPI0018D357A7|nr:GNAT family N-acetyltransferase [Erythrobacter sp. YJ-T3-07]